MLREENYMFKQAQNNPLCPRCTNDPGFLQILKELEEVKAYNRMLQQQLQVQHVTRCLKWLSVSTLHNQHCSCQFAVSHHIQIVFLLISYTSSSCEFR